MDTVELKCNSCGHNLLMTDKGLECPNCDKEKTLVVKRTMFGFKVMKSVNVLLASNFLTLKDCENLTDKGVDVQITY